VPVEHFTYGWLTPTLSYALSVLGSLLGLLCTVRARAMVDKARRARWLLLAAWAIGGTGIWVMHFMAMIGFSIPGLPVRYDIPITVASWLTAIVVVAIGLFIVGYGRPNAFKILLAGTFTGVGVAAMHYTGMAAMHTSADVHYDRDLVIASVVIAVVAATVALWFTVTLKRGLALTVAALIMGVAVNGMHFTGMYALRIGPVSPRTVNGILPIAFLAPIVLFVVAVIIVLMVALLNRAGTDGGDGTPAPRAPQPTPAIPTQRKGQVPSPSGMGSAFGARAKR
jgi:NO-binding membrane sensor protein with MHYT domain